MSYFRLQANIISKKNQSAVASASYRSGEELYSERDMEMKSFHKREVAPVSFILKPDHAPEWTLNRERLWNEVENVEKAWNAQLAREVLIALPIELNADQQQALVQQFVQEEFVNAGMVADVSIHRDKAHNPHAHILLTIRPFNKDGSWGKKKVRQYEYDQNGEILRNDVGEKVFQTVSSTNWNERDTLVKWRLDYAEAINQSFKEHGIEKTVSALSFEEQGLDRIPEIRLERNEYQYVKRMEKKGLEAKTFYHQLNQEIRKTNAEIKQLNQKISFLSEKQRPTDVQSTLHRHTTEVMQQLDSDYQKSMRFVEDRLKGNVSFQTVYKQLEGLYRWEERTLEPKQLETNVTHAILNATHSAYQQRDAAMLKDQGFPVKGFLEVFTERLEAFEKLEEAIGKDKQTNENVTAHFERSFRVQSLIVHNTFNELYPETEDRYLFNNRTAAFKAEVIQAMQEGEGHRVPSPHEMSHQLQLQELIKTCTQAEKINDSIRIQSMMRNKLGAEKERLLKSGKDLDAVYQTSVKLNTAQKLVERYQEKAKHFDQQLGKLIRETFPHVSKRFMRKVDALPLEMKTDLIKHYVAGASFNKEPSFKECLGVAVKEQEKRTATYATYRNKQSSSFYQRLTTEQQQTAHFPNGQASTELLDELVRQAAHPNSYEKDPGQLAKLNRKGRNTRMRRHLGLEIEL